MALTLVLVAAAHADERPRAALLVASAPGPGAAQLGELRAELGRSFLLVDDERTRALLEGFARPPSPEERVSAALARAHQRLRRFDLPGVRLELDEALLAAAQVTPTDEGRRLVADVAVREAGLALVLGNVAEQRRAMAYALSAEPQLQLDPRRDSPALIALLDETRAAQRQAPRATLAIASDPPGAQIFVAGANRGAAPVEVGDLAAGPQLVWATRGGSTARALRVEVTAGAAQPLTIALAPLDEERRLRPLVDAVRQAEGDARRDAALTLALALGVDALAVAGDGPLVLHRRPAPPPTKPNVVEKRPQLERAQPAPWFRRAWVWTLATVATVAIAGIAITAGVLSLPQPTTLTCCF